MTSLYSARFHPAGVLLLKFDRDLNHEASYLVSNGNCECPAASRPTCRHRKMLPFFEKAGHIGDGWFLDWDTRLWQRPILEGEYEVPKSVPDSEALADDTILGQPLSSDPSPIPVLGQGETALAENGAAPAVVAPKPPAVEQPPAPAGGFQIKRRKL